MRQAKRNGGTPYLLSNQMKKLIFYSILCVTLVSCGSSKLTTYSVGYQSVRTRYAQPTTESPIPDEAKIAVAYGISEQGDLTAVVYNRTSEIMTIDQTMSFFVNSNGMSTSYYDPTVKSISNTDMSSVTKGASVNLGSITGALGIGGTLGKLAGGINVGGSGTSGTAQTETTYIADQPRVSIAPHGNGAMSKVFKISGIGKAAIGNSGAVQHTSLSEQMSPCRFSVCISYSFDGGNTFDKIVTDFYLNSEIVVITKKGHLNNALKEIYSAKPDAINEYWWYLYFNTADYSNGFLDRVKGLLYDYK